MVTRQTLYIEGKKAFMAVSREYTQHFISLIETFEGMRGGLYCKTLATDETLILGIWFSIDKTIAFWFQLIRETFLLWLP